MQRIYTYLLLLVCLSLTGAVNAQQTDGKALLWRINGNGLTKPSYLYGGTDMICMDDLNWSQAMQDRMNECTTVCFQLDIADPMIKEKAKEAITIRDGRHLKDYFAPAVYPKVVMYAKDSLGVDLENLQRFTPLAVQPFIVKKLLGCPGALSYDLQMMQLALKAGKKITGLETIDETMQTADAIKFNDKVAMALTEMATGSNYYKIYRTSLVQAHKQQDLPQMNDLFRHSRMFSDGDIATFLGGSINRWASRMPALMQQAPVFFEFNGVYLGGNDGLIAKLRKAGYTVDPVQ